jgi:hypothetical protein
MLQRRNGLSRGEPGGKHGGAFGIHSVQYTPYIKRPLIVHFSLFSQMLGELANALASLWPACGQLNFE